MRRVLFWAVLTSSVLGASCAGVDEGSEPIEEARIDEPSTGDAYGDATRLSLRGDSLLAGGDPAAAVLCYRRAAELDPGFLDAHMKLGEALLRVEDYQGAIHAFREVVSLDPDSDRALYGLGFALWQERKLEEARYHMEAALAQSSDSVLIGKIRRSLRSLDEDY